MPGAAFFPRSCNVVIINTRNQFVFCQVAPNHSFHVTVAFIVPALLNLLQLKYQGNAPESVFDAHPMTVRFAAGCLLVYCLVYAVELAKFYDHSQVCAIFVHRCKLLLGSLSIASLASIIFPSSIQPFLFGTCIMVSVGYQVLFNPIEMFMNSIYRSIRSRFLRTVVNNVRDRGSILPV